MADERVVSEVVTKFLLNTCRRRPQLSEHAVQAAELCAGLAAKHTEDDGAETDLIPLITGSFAEFYIEPMLPHVGDIDVMFHRSTDLAIPRGHPPPTQLPAEFHNYVKVFQIVDSHLPGYVYLQIRYLLTECIDDKYSYTIYEPGLYLVNNKFMQSGAATNPEITSHGPALLRHYSNKLSLLSTDFVSCVRCLSWPPQAADWPTRHRNYNWPDSANVDRVVNNGCDVVPVAHRQCREHEWVGKYQWRLSFSRAEIVLINSWMPVQQIVYHMLRVFVKTEQLANSAENTESYVLSNYHIKTLMMWACELKSSSFWIDDVNLIRICVELLHTLSLWLTDARCQHYFTNDCNLIDNPLDVEITSGQLKSIDEAWLSNWFVRNYIRKCSMLCPDNISRWFSDVGANTKLHNLVSAVVNWRIYTAPTDIWIALQCAESVISMSVPNNRLTVWSCVCWMTEFTKLDTHFSIYFTAVAFLHIANKISMFGLNDELMDVLATITGQFISKRRYPSQCSSELSLSKATKLMKAVADSSHSTMQLIEIELSKAYLYTALRCKDSDSDYIYCLANVYLAVLYYTTGQYQTAIDHCTLVMRSQDHSQCNSHVVQGELLPKIDDDIDSVLGLAVFYQYVRTAALNQRQKEHVTVFTTELFVFYLKIICIFSHIPLYDEVHRFINYFCNTPQLFIADVLGAKSVIGNFRCQRITLYISQKPTLNASHPNTSELVDLLQRSAVERLTTYRQLISRDFGSVAVIITSDFEALYAYKHRDYQRCLQLSVQNVISQLYAVRGTSESTFPPFYDLPVIVVPILPVFIQLLDDDIVSLTALTLIVNPECRDCSYNADVLQVTLLLYLMTQCQLKLRHSVPSLALTLINYIKVAQRIIIRLPDYRTLDHLILKMIEHKVVVYLWNSITTEFPHLF